MPELTNGNSVPSSYTTDRFAHPANPPVAAVPPVALLPPVDGEPPVELDVGCCVVLCELSAVSPPQDDTQPKSTANENLETSRNKGIVPSYGTAKARPRQR